MADAKTAGLLSELGVEDLYGFLGVDPQGTEKEITRAYRKKALKYHPDKNPDDPNAAEMFQKLSKILTILTDPVARASYDRWQRAKHAARRRHEELSAKRRKLKEELESRESQRAPFEPTEREAAAKMQKEIERLREETQRKIQEQEELLRQQMARGGSPADSDSEDMPTIKVTWKAKKSDPTNGGYSEQLLEGLFSRYGPLHHILVSAKRKGKALISFHSAADAQAALERESGMPACPLTISWVCGEPSAGSHAGSTGGTGGSRDGDGVTGVGCDSGDSVRGDGGGGDGGLVQSTDYESIVLMKLRQAEERKRLNEQLARDGDS